MTVPSPVVLVAADFVKTGGMDRANYALALYLARAGHLVQLVTHRAAPDLMSSPGVSVVAVRKPLGSYFLGERRLSAAGRLAARASGVRVLVNGGNCPVPDANWVHYVHAAYRPTPTGSLLRRIKAAIEKPINRHNERKSLRLARVVIANSHRTRRDIVEGVGIREERVHVVYYGTDPAVFRPADDVERAALRERLGWPQHRPVVLFIGALGDRRKGFDTLFDAWSRVCRESGWDAVLNVIGEGAERRSWESKAAEAGLAGSIQFLGFRTDVPDLVRAADALAAPTRYEAYGLGVHEALCCGLPALVTATAGVAERYPAELHDLLLPDANDAADLANRLRRWYADRTGWTARMRPLSEELRSWTWDDMARAVWERIA